MNSTYVSDKIVNSYRLSVNITDGFVLKLAFET